MKLNGLSALFILLLSAACTQQQSGTTHHPLTAPLFELADNELDGGEAYNTTAYVEQFWRLAGNPDFDKSIKYVENVLSEAGFVEESRAGADDRLTYRVEKRPMRNPAWQPYSGFLATENNEEILNFKTNRNMFAINSYRTDGTEEYEVIRVETENGVPVFDENTDLTGKAVYAETAVNMLFNEAVVKRGAAGVIAYRMPGYLNPEINQTSIQFSRIPLHPDLKSWGVLLSYAAREKLNTALGKGENKIRIQIETDIFESEELTIAAELKGSRYPEERLVFSAHIQEPGANDNASGTGALAEVASTSARLLKAGKINPERTITYLFGDEIISTNRFITEDADRAKNIKWGISLDMVGEDTEKTGGTFLIEKMPDPAAIWTRGEEKHSEWGGRPLSKEEMMPHYLNDFILNRMLEQGRAKNWVVKVNPYEGGSDHAPFLRNDIPGLLLWHFTDQFYHTDNDRIDKVSKSTLKNVGTGALVSALVLTGNQEKAFDLILEETTAAALSRLETEFNLSAEALKSGGSVAEETDILNTWAEWYMEAVLKTDDILTAPTAGQKQRIRQAVGEIQDKAGALISKLQ